MDASEYKEYIRAYPRDCFHFSANFLRMVFPLLPRDTECSEKTGVKTGVKLLDLILGKMREDPKVTYVHLAESLGKAESTIADAVNRLKQEKRVRRVGPAKGGHWEVVRGWMFEICILCFCGLC